MKFLSTICLATLGIMGASPIWAEATDAGAADLVAVFQTYLGSTDGVVSVAVEGADYAVTLDLTPLMSAIPVDGMTASASPLTILVTDMGDGIWNYKIDQPFSMTYAVAGQMKNSTDYASVQVSGVFDEALGDTSAYDVAISGISSEQTQTDPTLGEMTVKNTVESLTWKGTATAGATGVDSVFTSTTSGISYDMMVPVADGAAPMTLTGTVASGTAEGSVTGYQPAAIYALLAWAVAHPDQAMIEADKPGLKALIEAALPLFDTLAISGDYSDVAVSTPLGLFGLAQAGLEFEMNGAVPDGLVREAISLTGLTLPEGLLPPFAAPLIPQEMTLDLAVSRFDLAATAQLALTLLDLPAGATPPEGFDLQLLAALMPEGVVDVTLAPGGVRNATYALTYEGNMTAGAEGMPLGTAKVTLAGIDGIMTALDAAPPEMTAQIIPMIGMAQAMGQPGPDGALVWEIDTSTPGSLMVNGMDMMGGQ